MSSPEVFTNLQSRAIFGIGSAIVVVAAIIFSHIHPFEYCFLTVLALIQSFALWEFWRLSRAKEFHPLSWPGIVFSALFLFMRFWAMNNPDFEFYREGLLYLFALTIFAAYFRRQKQALANISITFFGFFYIAIPLSLMIDLNFGFLPPNFEQAPLWLVFLIFITKVCDTGAYFVGKLYGRRPLAPLLSPNKTVEGTVGGFVSAIFAGCVFFALVRFFDFPLFPDISFVELLLLSAALAIAAILGDLGESLLKRDAALKDSNILPGVGGILDMVDSLLFTTPLLYIYLRAKLLI
jgi:phosphatidate cytidylyltransferase